MNRRPQLEIWVGQSGREEVSLLPPELCPRPGGWKRPTFGEFHFAGVTRGEKLEPSDIRTLCLQVGVTAEDFGIEP